MASAGQSVDEAVISGAGSPGTVASRILAALKGIPELGVAPAGGNAYRLTRRFRPTWALVLACAGAPLLLSLLFLLVRKEESCLLTVSAGPSGTTVRLSGDLLRQAHEAIRAAAAPLAVAPAPAFATGSATITRWQMRLGSGRATTIDGLVLVGRDPAAGPGEHAHSLVSVDDPGKSVSKTHLALGPHGTGVWLMDRHSTNGTAVIDRFGQRTECPPGRRVVVDPPCRLLFGDLEATLLPA